MSRVIVQHRHLRGPSGAAERAKRKAAGDVALGLMTRLTGDLEGCTIEFAQEVERLLVRALAVRMSSRTDASRSIGILAGAAAGICPEFVAPRAGRSEAEKLFAPKVDA